MPCRLALFSVWFVAAFAADLQPITAPSTVPASAVNITSQRAESLQKDIKTQFRLERTPVAGDSELLTIFGELPETSTKSGGTGETARREVPLVAILRDTLGDQDPANDRLRYVWVLTSAGPTMLQRMAAATPFYYWRAGVGKDPNQLPSPVLDLSAAAKPVWAAMAGTITQLAAFDPNGAIIRSSTRSYRNNIRDHRQLHLLEGLAVLSQLEDVPDVKEHLSEPELLAIQARLALAGQTFGGLVSESNLSAAYMNRRTATVEDRGHNWELLRQRAEANGLYFEPFGLNGVATQALLFVAKQDLNGKSRTFDGQFLGIRDPFNDPKLKKWTGYSQVKDLGPEQGRVELIPLALYSLDHPKVPLLLVDFRDTTAPKRREMIRHAAVDAVSGVIGYSRWGNWPYFAGTVAFNFVSTRHGGANDRTARIRGYSQVRQWIALDPAIDPALRSELQKRLEMLGVNPLEDNVTNEAKFAQSQYDALLRYAKDPKGLEAKIERSREAEAVALDHGFAARAGLNVIHYASFGAYTHREANTLVMQTRIDESRRGTRRTIAILSYDDR
jgi:hypothetical protein